MKLAFLLKGNIRNKKRFYENLTKVENAAICEEVEVFESKHYQHTIELAAKATDAGFTHLIAVGGDGTVNEVLNGIMQANRSKQIKTMPVIGILPMGTANDISKALGVTNKVEELISLLEKNSHSKIDIGTVESINKEGVPLFNYFMNVADAGIGGYVVAKVNSSKKRLGANLTFLKAITETFLTYEQSEVKLVIDNDLEWKGKILSLVVANGAYYGSGMRTDSEVKMNDGLFNIIVMNEIGIKDFILNVGKLKKGRIKHPRVHYFTGKEVEITPLRYSCPAEMDGEYIGFAPLKVKLIPQAISVLCPEGSPFL